MNENYAQTNYSEKAMNMNIDRHKEIIQKVMNEKYAL